MPKYKVVVYLSSDQLDFLEEYASKLGVSRGELIRDIISTWILDIRRRRRKKGDHLWLYEFPPTPAGDHI
jgi:metal-responsive CopG/Arc/MetJ family transcriptional regulator